MTGERLRLIQGGKPKRRTRVAQLWAGCQVCEVDIGVRSRTLVQVIQAPEVNTKGVIVGGRKIKACAMCLARGKFTPHSI